MPGGRCFTGRTDYLVWPGRPRAVPFSLQISDPDVSEVHLVAVALPCERVVLVAWLRVMPP